MLRQVWSPMIESNNHRKKRFLLVSSLSAASTETGIAWSGRRELNPDRLGGSQVHCQSVTPALLGAA